MIRAKKVGCANLGSNMVIRKAQMQALEEAGLQAHAHRIVAFVRKVAPNSLEDLPEDELERRARLGIPRGRAYGMEGDTAVGLFVTAMFVGGPGFENEPECSAVLEDSSLPPDARMFHLFTDQVRIPWPTIRVRCAGNPW